MTPQWLDPDREYDLAEVVLLTGVRRGVLSAAAQGGRLGVRMGRDALNRPVRLVTGRAVFAWLCRRANTDRTRPGLAPAKPRDAEPAEPTHETIVRLLDECDRVELVDIDRRLRDMLGRAEAGHRPSAEAA